MMVWRGPVVVIPRGAMSIVMISRRAIIVWRGPIAIPGRALVACLSPVDSKVVESVVRVLDVSRKADAECHVIPSRQRDQEIVSLWIVRNCCCHKKKLRVGIPILRRVLQSRGGGKSDINSVTAESYTGNE